MAGIPALRHQLEIPAAVVIKQRQEVKLDIRRFEILRSFQKSPGLGNGRLEFAFLAEQVAERFPPHF